MSTQCQYSLVELAVVSNNRRIADIDRNVIHTQIRDIELGLKHQLIELTSTENMRVRCVKHRYTV